jgi:hypothetical protein
MILIYYKILVSARERFNYWPFGGEGESLIFKRGLEIFCPHALEKDLEEFGRQGSSWKIHLNKYMEMEQLPPLRFLSNC